MFGRGDGMTSHMVRSVWFRSVLRLLAAAATLAGATASAQVIAEDPVLGWDDEQVPASTVTDGEWTDASESFAVAGDGLPQAAALEACAPCEARRPCATWRWRAEALTLWRSSPRDRPLFSFVDGDTVAGTALDASQLVSDPLAAPRLSLFRDNGCGPILEANYLWAGNFYSQRSLPFIEDGYATSPPGIFGNDWGPATDTSLNAAQATLLANLQTAELNIRERFLHGLAQFIVGFRWLQWNESLQMQDSYNHDDEFGVITGNDFYRTDCFNNLYGGQIGVDAMLLGHKPGFHVDGLVKAGAFYNDASQRSTFSYINNRGGFADSNRADSPDGAAFVGEVGMTAVIPVHCNLDLRVGYFGLWIEGLAQPANQLSTQTITQDDPISGSLDTTGGALLQGLSLGLEGRW